MVKTAKGFVVFRRNGAKVEYLLLQACYGIQHWTPPKGHVEKGEVEFETAYRETNEETGLVKTDYKVIDEYKQELNYLGKKGKPKIVIYWLAELINQDAEIKLSHEHINYIWASLDQACELIEFEETRGLIKRCDEYIKTL